MVDENKDDKFTPPGPTGGQSGATPEPIVKKETVVVDREMLESILKEVQGLRDLPDQIAKLTKENQMLTEVADKGRLETWQHKNNPRGLVRVCRAWVWNGKLVKATLTIRNQAFTDANGRIHTDQVLNVIDEDGKEKEVSYDQFMKERTLVDGDIIKRSTDEENGQVFFTLKLKDGKEFTVNSLFTN